MIQINTKDCTWDSKWKCLAFHRLHSFPHEVEVKSHRTGKVVKFVLDIKRAMEMEFWDGEMSVLIPTTPCGVDRFILTTQEV